MIRYIIVDDEPIAHRIIEDYGNNLPFLELAKHCYNAMEAMEYLNHHVVDLMFLDINMPKLKGFDLLKALSKPPKVIVTTAYKEFALEGYELNVCDYLLKPFSFQRFVKAVNKVSADQPEKTTITQKVATESAPARRLFLKADKKYRQVRADDILFVEAYGNYCKVYLPTDMIVTHEKISALENTLPDGQFLRVHKSFIVAIEQIELIEGNRIKIRDHAIPIGQIYKRNVTRLLKNT